MRTSDTDIFIIPGYTDSGEDHWQTRWERKLSAARRVVQDDWHFPRKDEWVPRIIHQVSQARKPAIIVAHSLGVLAAVHAADQLPKGLVHGAFLVAPPDLGNENVPEAIDRSFGDGLDRPLPFPAVLVASRNDPYCSFERAEELARHWKAEIADAGNVGHINTESGHGPWPEGTLRFASFLKKLHTL